jgi:hypothetical protein
VIRLIALLARTILLAKVHQFALKGNAQLEAAGYLNVPHPMTAIIQVLAWSHASIRAAAQTARQLIAQAVTYIPNAMRPKLALNQIVPLLAVKSRHVPHPQTAIIQVPV